MAPLKLLASAAFRWALVSLALFVLATSLIVGLVLVRSNDLMTQQALQVILADAQGLREQYRSGGLPVLIQTVSARSLQPGEALYLLTDDAGNRLAGNLERVPSEFTSEGASGPFHYRRPGESGEATERLAVGIAYRVGEQAHMLVARDVEGMRAFAQAIRATFLWGVGLLSLIALGTASLYARRLLSHVDEVTSTSQRIMAGDLSQRLSRTGSGDEMDRLSASLNQMLERIEQLMAGLREVSDNIAHDLKTPLTRLRNRAEAALRDPNGGPAHAEGLERTIEEADELIRTFNALLSIARLEAGTGAEQTGPIDLIALVRDAVELYEPVADEAGLKIALTPDNADKPAVSSALTVKGDRQLMGQALANLIENAMKYGCEGTRAVAPAAGAPDITIRVIHRPGWADVCVADRGAGIPAADRERVLKRFVRLEASRTQPGTGLGLSLVAAVARLHKGSVRLEDNAPGLRVILSLPLAAPETTMVECY